MKDGRRGSRTRLRNRGRSIADCAPGTSCVVYAQFKDGAENESLVVYDEILYELAKIYLPLVMRND